MLAAAALIASILGYALLINRALKWPLETSLLFINSSIISILLWAGLLGNLRPVAQVLLWTGLVLFLAPVVSQRHRTLFRNQISPGIMFFVGSSIFIWALTDSTYYSNFVTVDDFAHWGRFSKIIASQDRLINSADPVAFKDYPPGLALFHYMLFQNESYSERLAMFSQGVFILAALSHLFAIIPRSGSRYTIIGLSVYVYASLYIHGLGLHTLMADLALGVTFGMGLFGYFIDREDNPGQALLRLIPIVTVLPLIKQIGIFFSLITVATVACDIAINQFNRPKAIRFLGIAALLGLSSILSYGVWTSHVTNMVGNQRAFPVHFTASNVTSALFSDTATERQKVTLASFSHRLVTPFFNGYKKINMQQYLLLTGTAFILFLRRVPTAHDRSWKQLRVPIAVLMAGFALYLLLLLTLYIFSFSEYEGTRLASFDRYANTYLAGILLMLFGLSLSRHLGETRNKATTFAFIFFSVLSVFPNLRGVILDISHIVRAGYGGQTQEILEIMAQYPKLLEAHTPEGARVYFIWQHTKGEELQRLSYAAMSRRFNPGCSSLGEPYDEGDVWTCKTSSGELEQTLANYDFMLIGQADSKLEDILHPIIGMEPISSGGLYAIENTSAHITVQRVK